MRKALVKKNDIKAGILQFEMGAYQFQYFESYTGSPISLTMPVRTEPYLFDQFPPFFDGLLPEGDQLDGLLKIRKLDKYDYLGQLIAIGGDTVGDVTIETLASDE